MSAEHLRALRSGGTIDPRSDLFSLGVILFELLGGQLPFPVRSGTYEQVADEMIADRLGPTPSLRAADATVTPDLASIVEKCLAPEADQRYQSARQLLEDIQRHRHDLSPRFAPRRSIRERVAKWARRHPRLTSISTVGTLAALLLAVALWGLWARTTEVSRLEAARESSAFVQQLQRTQLGLTVPHQSTGALRRSLDAGHHILARFGAETPSAHRRTRRMGRLGDGAQQAEQIAAGRLWYWMADATRRMAMAAATEWERQNEIRRAVEYNGHARDLLADAGPSRSLLAQQADLLRALNETARAERHDREALQAIDPDPMGPLIAAAEHLRARRYDEAVALLQSYTPSQPLDYQAWLMMAFAYAGQRRWDSAESCLDICIALDATAAEGFVGRGTLHLDRQDFAAAAEDFDRAVALSPGDTSHLLNRALAYRGLGRWEDAERDLTAAIDAGTTETRAYFLRSRVRKQLGDLAGAEADLKTGLQLVPGDADSWTARGVARLATDPESALADFAQAHRIDPLSVPAMQNCAAVLAGPLERPLDAIPWMTRLVEAEPDQPTHRATRGVLYARVGRRTDALADADAALAIRRDADTLYRVAGIYAQTSRANRDEPQADAAPQADDVAQALSLLREAAALDPRLVADYLALDPDIKPLETAPGFDEIQTILQTLRQWRLPPAGEF
jgi:tetratricopeptide (TPR) repeat protein